MNIRKFMPSDQDDLIALWRRVFPDDPAHNEPAQVLQAKLEVDDLIFVAILDDKLVGACMVGYDGHRGWLYAVAVAPEARRSGVGAALVKQATGSLKQLGCIKVNLQIRAGNTEVAAFYESLGFACELRLSMGAFIE